MKVKRIAGLTVLLLLIASFTLSFSAFAVKNSKAKHSTSSKPKATQSTQATEPPTQALPSGAFTPNGQGSVLDYVENSEDEKLFYTITTPSGNVFYLVVDEARDAQNVYFLNAVTESDLMELAEKNENITINKVPSSQSCSCTDKCTSDKVNEDCPVCKSDPSKCAVKTSSTSDEVSTGTGGKSKNGDDGGSFIMYGIIAAAFLVVAGIGVYAKIIRPKKQQATFDDDDEGEGYSDDYGAEEYGSTEYLPEDDPDGEE